MAPPRPIDEIDFPDVGAKIVELLYALWTFFCDIFIVLWFYVSEAFGAAWTYPPFESFRTEFTAALVALWNYAVAHPITSTAIGVLAFIVLPAAFNWLKLHLLRGLGLGKRGMLHGSNAIRYQSTGYSPRYKP